MPKNAHPDSTFSSHLHNDWTQVQTAVEEYSQPDIRGPMPKNAHPDSTFSSHLHNDWTQVQLNQKNAIESDDESSSDDEEDVDLQTGDIDVFQAWENGAHDNGYTREIPERFSEERDDTLMRSLIQNYAIEIKDDKAKPTGHFFFNKEAASNAADEIVKTHGSNDKSILQNNFEDTWNHFDINKDGLVEVERMP